jgi:integrase
MGNKWSSVKRYYIALLAACVGLRANEFAELKWDSIKEIELKSSNRKAVTCYEIIFFQNKNRKERKVAVPK